MELLFERHILRKLQLIESLYFSQHVLGVHDLAKRLNVSESTIKSDLKQFGLINDEGAVLLIREKDKRMDLHDRIVSDSLMTRIMRLLLYYPGRKADSYSTTLSISRVNFYKHVNYWNERLKPYKATIIVHDGYHIVAQDERLFRFFIFYFLLATHSEKSPFIVDNAPVFSQILSKNNLTLGNFIRGDEWEESFVATILGVHIARQSNTKTAINLPQNSTMNCPVTVSSGDLERVRQIIPSATFKSVIESLYEFKTILSDAPRHVKQEDVIEIIDRYQLETKRTFNLETDSYIIEAITSILSYGSTCLENFPFDVSGSCVTMKDFITEYEMINKEVTQRFRRFLSIAHEVTGHDFKRYEEMIFYWIVINIGDFLFTPSKDVLFVSRYSENHLTFCQKEILSLMNILKIDAHIEVITKEAFYNLSHEKNYDLILSDCNLDTSKPVISISFSNGILSVDTIRDIFKNQKIHAV